MDDVAVVVVKAVASAIETDNHCAAMAASIARVIERTNGPRKRGLLSIAVGGAVGVCMRDVFGRLDGIRSLSLREAGHLAWWK